jgi:hypothetical protein
MDWWRRRRTQTRTPNHTAFLCGTRPLKFSVASGTRSNPTDGVHSRQCFLRACLGDDGIAQECPLDMHLLGLQPTTVRRGASAAARPSADDVKRGPGWLSRSKTHTSLASRSLLQDFGTQLMFLSRGLHVRHHSCAGTLHPAETSHPQKESARCICDNDRHHLKRPSRNPSRGPS